VELFAGLWICTLQQNIVTTWQISDLSWFMKLIGGTRQFLQNAAIGNDYPSLTVESVKDLRELWRKLLEPFR
jgi:hypothetical protein